jgi:phenylpropionate dioxygenase-like ring-hydroxylating dioxygenase large terminal subunit
MSNIDPAIIDRVPLAITDPERIPSRRYYDEQFYKLEVERMWPHVWQMACRLEQIPEVGDWIEYSNVGYSVIVVRTNDGVKAFHNACRHRGVPFAGGTTVDGTHATAHGNCAKTGFICPFHGWRWNMDGENTFVYGRHLFSERQLDPDDINLVPCRVETAIGCAFINLDDDAPSLRDSLGPVLDRFDAHRTSELRAEWQFGTVLPANWKIAMEAFMEGLHVMQTHPQLYKAHTEDHVDSYNSPDAGKTSLEASRSANQGAKTKLEVAAQVQHFELLSEGMAGMIHAKEVEIAKELADADLPEDASVGLPMWFGMVMKEITERLQARGEPVPDIMAVSQSDPLVAVEFLFPHYFLLPIFASMSAYRIRPLGPEHCLFELWSLTSYPQGEEPEPAMEPVMLPFDSAQFPPIPRQDYSNIPIQQRGLHSKGFQYMRLAKGVEGLISNYQRIIDGYLAGVPQEKLAKANSQLGGNFDGPILDLGF